MKRILSCGLPLLLYFLVGCQSFKNVTDSSNLNAENFQLNSPSDNYPPKEILIDSTLDEALRQAVFNKQLVLEAKRLGYDKQAEFVNELNNYESILSQDYLTDSIKVKQLLKETYDWMHYEIRASHIMYNVSEWAAPKDTLAIYNKLIEIRQKALNGEDFGKLAKTYSEDKKTNYLGGDLNWFTALQLTYPLEKAAYETPVGQISLPIRTKGGYHIIKVFGRRPYSGEVQVKHLMKVVTLNSPDSVKVKAKIDSLYGLLLKGANFEELCQKYSDDPNSKNFGGILPKFQVGRRESSFENAAFALKTEGEISKPIRTEAGYHILKLVKKIPLDSYEAMLPKLKDKVSTDSRGELVKESTLLKLKKEFQFSEDPNIIKAALQRADTSLFSKKWNYQLMDTLLNKNIITFPQKKVPTQAYFDYVVERQRLTKPSPEMLPVQYMQELYNNFANSAVMDYAKNHLEEKSSEFKELMNQYRESLLITRVLNDYVYEKSISDTTAQRAYYEANISKYSLPERIYGAVITSNDSKYLQQIQGIVAKGTPYQLKRGIKPIYFDKFKSELTPDIQRSLLGLLAVMRKYPSYIVEVGGNAAETEPASKSAERLKNVVNFLIANGLPLTRITEHDYLQTKPEFKTDDSKNSRVSFQFFSNSKQDLEKVLNAKNPNSVQIKEGYFVKGDNHFVDAISWSKGEHAIETDGKKAVVEVERVEPARKKTLREARGEVIKAYQIQLEKKFREELNSRFPIKLSDSEMKQLLEDEKKL